MKGVWDCFSVLVVAGLLVVVALFAFVRRGVRISGLPRPNLGSRLGQVGSGAHLSCGAPGPVPLRFWLGGCGADRRFSSGSGGFPVGSAMLLFFKYFYELHGRIVFDVFCMVNLSVRNKSLTNKICWGRGFGAWWG